MDVQARKTVEERLRQQVHVAGAHDELDSVACQPVRHRLVSFAARVVVGQSEDGRGDAVRDRALQRLCAVDVRGDRVHGQILIEQGLEVGATARGEDADHALSAQITPRSPSSSCPMTGNPVSRPSLGGTTAQKPTPRLKTRRCSSSAIPARQARCRRGPLPACRIDPSPQAGWEHARQVPGDAAARDVGEPRTSMEYAGGERRPGRAASGQAQVGVEVILSEHASDEREPVRVQAGDGARGRGPRFAAEPSTSSACRTRPTHVPAKSSSPSR